MSLTKKDLLNELWDASLITLGSAAVTLASRKILKYDLGVSTTPQGIIYLIVAIGGGSFIIQYLQKKKFLPDDPFE